VSVCLVIVNFSYMEVVQLNIPHHLITAVKNGSAVPFVGAGISRPSGIPTWQTVVNAIINLAKQSGIEEGQIKNKYNAPDTYFGKLQKSNEYYDFIYQAVGAEFEPNELHDWLSKIQFKTIITTNWDKLIEKKFGREKINTIMERSNEKTVS